MINTSNFNNPVDGAEQRELRPDPDRRDPRIMQFALKFDF